jgi:hypothetical protein
MTKGKVGRSDVFYGAFFLFLTVLLGGLRLEFGWFA